MSKACYVREDLVYNLEKWCDIYQVAIVGAPFECDSQLVGDELSQQGGISASMTIDSDFFVLGSKIMINYFDIKSGRCNIIRRDETFKAKPDLRYDDGEPYDMPIYASLVGCDL